MINDLITRRDALRVGALGIGALGLAACGSSSSSGAASNAPVASNSKSPVTLNMLTWNDHYYPSTQWPAIKKETGISVNVTLGSDDAAMFIKAQQSGQFDIVSADALWVPYYHQQGLTNAFDINDIPASKDLYSVSRDFSIWQGGGGYLAYPRAWSALRIYYNPKFVSPAPTSYEVLLDPKYHGKFVRENQPTDIMAEAGLATGAKAPYNMNSAELSRATEWLKAAKPAFLTLVSQNTGVVQALTNESAWFTSENLGTDIRVKEAGGPLIKAAVPKEGVVGWLDAEQQMKTSHANRFNQFINAWGQPEWVVPLFKEFKEAWFNEAAYKLLVNAGQKEFADALLYNQPEEALKAHLKGPAKNPNAYITAFNSVFGA
ncbi:MAG TPA: ABC transporter substrate-binding protein [Solirubrobacteraceae bacterium]|jgi:spermidine/putrescine-binding protein|nr:ABC transporter substrate-binding protein [Solirubrobacteraceae bacterium]